MQWEKRLARSTGALRLHAHDGVRTCYSPANLSACVAPPPDVPNGNRLLRGIGSHAVRRRRDGPEDRRAGGAHRGPVSLTLVWRAEAWMIRRVTQIELRRPPTRSRWDNRFAPNCGHG